MPTPDFLEQVVISGRHRTREAGTSVAGDRSRREQPSISAVVWALLDVVTAVLAGLIALRLRLDVPSENAESILWNLAHAAHLPSLLMLVLFGVYLVLISRVFGLYRAGDNFSGLHEQRMTVQAVLTSGLLLCGTLYLTRGYAVSRIAVLLTVFLTMPMLMLRRALWRKLRERRYLLGLEVRNVLIVGEGRVAHALRNHLEALPHMGFRFKGFISLEPARERDSAHVVGDIRNCVAVARSLFVDEIYFSTPADKRTVVGVVEDARALGIEVRVVPDLYDGLAWNAPVEYIGQFPTIPLHRREFPRGAFVLKRGIDIVLATLALLVASPFMIGIAVMVRMDSPGPVFYRAERIGRKGRVFRCFKFRTMVQNADRLKKEIAHMNERDSVLFKVQNDPRITKVGAKLRKYSLDELPQFFNVLKGDMSLVGPRPPLASEVEKYDLAHLRRLDVLPGITGLWQIEARQDPSFDSYISLDTAYVENWNLMLDARILARTIGVVLAGTGS
jgi:exopolysaccharide biosynthesis polyprenyl glycosylphosphotransferase